MDENYQNQDIRYRLLWPRPKALRVQPTYLVLNNWLEKLLELPIFLVRYVALAKEHH